MVKRLTNPLRGSNPPLGNLMAAAARRLAVELGEGIRDAGFEGLSAAHAPVFQAIAPEGSTITELAEYAGMTKQAMGELVRTIRAHGYVTVEPSPHDGRAKLVLLTESGWNVVDAGAQIITEFDDRLNAAIGLDQVEAFRSTLIAIAGGTGAAHSRQTRVDTTVMR